MFETDLFVRDADRPYLYHVRKGVILATEEVIRGPIRWSRFVQGPYHRDLGFLDTTGYQRVPISLIAYNDSQQCLQQYHDKDWIAHELNQIILPETLTALHYYPGLAIASVVVGLPFHTEEALPERFKAAYPRDSPWAPAIMGPFISAGVLRSQREHHHRV